MLRYLTSGESHGHFLTVILEGVPAGFQLDEKDINPYLKERQKGYGRGARMAIEDDKINILAGVRFGRTLGSPITLQIENNDWINWREVMSVEAGDETGERTVVCPRPGHADLAGGLKYGHKDLRNILERASARETAMRVAVGSVARRIIKEFGMNVSGYVTSIGGVKAGRKVPSPDRLEGILGKSLCRTYDPGAEAKMKAKIDEAKKRNDTVGGSFDVIVTGVPVGLGSHVHWDRKLDGRLAQAVMSIQGIKAVEIGLGVDAGRRFGSEVHDKIYYTKRLGFHHKTNRAGGLTGGITNGAPVVVRATMKPISTLKKPLDSVDFTTGKPAKADTERSDYCAVPAASVVGEAVVAFEVASAFLEKFGGDSKREVERNYEGYLTQIRDL